MQNRDQEYGSENTDQAKNKKIIIHGKMEGERLGVTCRIC